MEAQLTSGSDGFDQTSRNSILGHLDRSTCDSTDNLAPKPSSPRPPVPSPTAPSNTVVGCRTKPEIPAPSCVVPQSAVEGGYACFSVKEILPPFCSVKNLRWVLETCNGASLRKSSTRDLSEEVDVASNTTAEPIAPKGPSSNATTAAVNTTDFILDNAMTSFSSSECSKPCILTKNNFVCVGTSRSSHLVTVVALNAAGKQVDRAFKRVYTVQSKNSGICRPASVKCVN